VNAREYNAVVTIWKALAIWATFAAFGSAFIFWAGSAHGPDLSNDMAAKSISAALHFQQRSTLVAVLRMERGHGSLKTCCYTADLRLRQNGTADSIPALANFSFYDKMALE
jgi:hypothetical protein